MSVIKIESLDHVVLSVESIEKMLPFYCNVLGMELTQQNSDGKFAQLRAGTAIVDMLKCRGTPSDDPDSSARKNERNMDHFALRLESFVEDDLRKHLKQFGIDAGKLWRNEGLNGHCSFYIQDPEFNSVELKGWPLANGNTE
jgi:glyoxylase I family protein